MLTYMSWYFGITYLAYTSALVLGVAGTLMYIKFSYVDVFFADGYVLQLLKNKIGGKKTKC